MHFRCILFLSSLFHLGLVPQLFLAFCSLDMFEKNRPVTECPSLSIGWTQTVLSGRNVTEAVSGSSRRTLALGFIQVALERHGCTYMRIVLLHVRKFSLFHW